MSSPSDFVHLHLHSEYSLLDGACRIDDIIKKAVDLNMPSVGLTDHGVMYGSMEFYLKAKKAGINPVVGCEVYVATRGRKQREGKKLDDNNHLVLLAKNETGYKNLLKLVSLASLEGFYSKPRVDKELLSQYSDGLICLSACLGGEVPERIMEEDLKRARDAAAEHREIFGKENYYLEIQDHQLTAQQMVNEHLHKLSKELDLPLVATNDVHYMGEGDADPHQVLLCVQTKTTLADPRKMDYGSKQFFLKSQEEMGRVFSDFPDALARTHEIAERCKLNLDFGRLAMPDPGDIPHEMNAQAYFTKLCFDGLRARYGEYPESYEERLRYEIDVIEKTGFANYFLIVRDFAQFARRKGIYFGVRGSAAGSLCSYCIGITDIDPVKYGLTFERFLNPERISMPDIDMDFEDGRRQEVIDYVVGKYGRDHVAQIITFGTLGAKAVMRDAGKVMGEISLPEIDKLCKMIPSLPVGITLTQSMEKNPEFKQAYETNPAVRRLIDTSLRLEGLTRHGSVHAAGIVIAADPLVENVPLQRIDGAGKDRSGEPDGLVTQYPANSLEKIGLLKMDFLGLTNLTILARAIENVKKNHGIEIDLLKMPLDDPAAYELLGRGDTTGIFQLESPQMRRYIAELRPSNLGDVAAMVALYRPGPMAQIPRFIKCKHGYETVKYPHPALEELLDETYGIIVYQDQVLRIVNKFAGFSMGQADILRKAMGKKDKDSMREQRDKFIAGAVEQGHKKEKAGEIFDLIEPFAGYAFNKAHSVCYAMVAYQTAYLKANYTLDFYSAIMATQLGDTERIGGLIEDARRSNIEILPPDVNHSSLEFTVEDGAIRYGLLAIKGIGKGAIESILHAREVDGKQQPFANLFDFCCRAQAAGMTSQAVVENLIKVGAFAGIEPERARLIAGLDPAWSAAQKACGESVSGQVSMFDDDESASLEPGLPINFQPFNRDHNMALEKELLGIYLSDHPLDQYSARLAKVTTHTCAEARHGEDQEKVVVAGVLSNVRPYYTKAKNELMYYLTLEDRTGTVSATLFPRKAKEFGVLAVQDTVVLIEGTVSHRESIQTPKMAAQQPSDDGLPSDDDVPDSGATGGVQASAIEGEIRVESIRAIAQLESSESIRVATEAAAQRPTVKLVNIRIEQSDIGRLGRLRNAFVAYPGDTPVMLHVCDRKAKPSVTKFDPSIRVSSERQVLDYIRGLVGDEGRVWVE